MKTYLEYKDEKSQKFWEIILNDSSHTVRYGKIGTTGQSKKLNFPSEEDAQKATDKLIQSKLKKGYVEITKEREKDEKGWFEKIEKQIFNAYKKQILKYKADNYQYIQFFYGQGFALGLLTDPNGNYWEYIDDEIEELSEENGKGIHNTYLSEEDDDDEYEVLVDREEWPYDDDDCFRFEAFIISVAFGKVFLDLKKDKDLKNHLSAITKLVISIDDSEYLPFTHSSPDQKLRLEAVKKFVGHPENQELILDLWSDQLKGSAVDFLKQLNTPLQQKIHPMDQFKISYDEAVRLYDKDLYKQSIELLEQILKTVFHEEKPEDAKLMEYTCAMIARNYTAQEKYLDAITWYKKGIEYSPLGYSPLNLMDIYKNSVPDFQELIIFGEKHIDRFKISNSDYTFYSYFYLAYAYVQLENKEKAENIYQKILKLFKDDREKIEQARDGLEEIEKSNSTAKSILEWFKID